MRKFLALAIAGIALATAGAALAAPAPPVLAAPTAPAAALTANVREVRGSTIPTSAATRSSEPAVAADPLNPKRLALVYLHGNKPVRAVVRISHDGGLTWKIASGNPGGGGYHLIVAWGPGPVKGRSRLYYISMTGSAGGVRPMTRYSDNEGATWSSPRIQMDTRPWVGGTPDITVDTNPASPNYGVVYATYNWPKSSTFGPGLHVLASSDYGRTFHAVEVPALPTTSSYPARHRIGYRLRSAPDGALYVSWYQADLRFWRAPDPLNKGSLSNIGRIRFGIARLVFNRKARTWSRGASTTAATLPRTAWNAGFIRPGGLTNDPQWSTGIGVDPATGRVLLAISVDGGIRVYRSDNKGRTWSRASIPSPSTVGGRAQYIAKPDLVIGNGFVAVTMRLLDRSGATSGHAYSLSADGGLTWTRPKAVSSVRWAPARVDGPVNGVGLRNRAAITADGRHVVFAYGDGRYGRYGFERCAVMVSVITVTVPPTPAPSPSPSADPSASPSSDPSASPSDSASPSVDPPPAP